MTAIRRAPRAGRREGGFTLIEVLVAALVLLIGVAATLGLFVRANRATTGDRQREGANSLARDVTEAARSIPFETLVGTNALVTRLKQMPGLQDSGAGAGVYTVLRRGTSYTVTPAVCTMDDPKDGGGTRPSGVTFCADSTPAGTADKNPEDYRRVTVVVSWKDHNLTRSVTQSEIINNPGSAAGPAVRSLVPQGWAAPYEVTSDVDKVTVQVGTSSKPAAITWSVDGTTQLTAPTQVAGDLTGLLWQFDWNVKGLDDGPYLISAQAFNANGLAGPGRTETVTLNRFLPAKPTGLAGGRNNFGQVELEWNANTERDIIGYEVELTDSAGTQTGQTVCGYAQVKLDTSCVDNAPPITDPIYYHVRAYDRTPGTGTPRPGPWSTPLKVVKTNLPPFPPTSLTATTTNAGTSAAVVTLKWSRPSPQDPDNGDSVAFYRIYRDGIALANRYDRSYDLTSNPTWKDTSTGGSLHTYFVTAVDTHYAESVVVGPVTGG